MKTLFQTIRGVVFTISVVCIAAAAIYWRTLQHRQMHDLPVPEWYRSVDDAMSPFLVPLLLAFSIYFVWEMGHINRPAKRPESTLLTSNAVGDPDADHTTFSQLPGYSKGMPGNQLSLSDPYLNNRLIVIAVLMIAMLLKFLRQILLPASVNGWIDIHHTLLIGTALVAVTLAWLYDSLFFKLPHAQHEGIKPSTRMGLIAKRLFSIAFIAGVTVTISTFDPVTNRWVLDQLSLDSRLLIALAALILSLFVRR